MTRSVGGASALAGHVCDGLAHCELTPARGCALMCTDVYWNLVLDAMGGPNVAGNYVDSPFYAINKTHFGMNPSFFYISHFSRFVPPGSHRVTGAIICRLRHHQFCQSVAFRTPAGDLVVVITNNDNKKMNQVPYITQPFLSKGAGYELPWKITACSGKKTVTGVIPWRAIQTVVLGSCDVGVHSEPPPPPAQCVEEYGNCWSANGAKTCCGSFECDTSNPSYHYWQCVPTMQSTESDTKWWTLPWLKKLLQ